MLDPEEPLTLERARELMGARWEARFDRVFEGEPPTFGEAGAMLRDLMVEEVAVSSTAVRFVYGRGACDEVVAKGRAATRARERAARRTTSSCVTLGTYDTSWGATCSW